MFLGVRLSFIRVQFQLNLTIHRDIFCKHSFHERGDHSDLIVMYKYVFRQRRHVD